mgnify:CR=1 FL=1
MSLFDTENLHKSFGGIKALDGVSFSVNEKSVVALIGPNGSGKTTLFNVATGFYLPDEGVIRFGGEVINRLKPEEIYLKGLARTFQICRIFPKMTVLENMLIAPKEQVGEKLFSTFFKWKKIIGEELNNAKKAVELLKFLELYELKDEYAGNLSGGQQKLLELGRVLMAEPKMVLLDEPVAGVNPVLANKIFEKILELRDMGMTFLIVEHNMDAIMSFCEKIYVMCRGKIVAEGSPEEIQNNEMVIDVYLGGLR